MQYLDGCISDEKIISKWANYTMQDKYENGKALKSEAVANGLKNWYKAMKANDEVEDFMFDCSYRNMWDYLRQELKLSKEEAYIFNCSGGGRCFDKDFQGNINPELSEIIREYES